MKLHAKTLAGLEDLVAQDMNEAGATEVVVGRRGVSCEADLKAMYHLCLHSRFVLRVLRHLTEFNAKNPDDLYRQSARFAWEDLILWTAPSWWMRLCTRRCSRTTILRHCA